MKKKQSPSRPDTKDHALALCHMLSNRISKAFAVELEKFDITVAEWRVLLTLALQERASAGEISNRWAMDKMAISRAVASLEKRDLIKKQQNSDDKRSFDLALTASGHTLYKKILPEANKRYHKLMAGLDRSEATTLRRTLLKMIEHIDGIRDE